MAYDPAGETIREERAPRPRARTALYTAIGSCAAAAATYFATAAMSGSARAERPATEAAVVQSRDGVRLDALERGVQELTEARKVDAAKLDRALEGLARIEGRLERAR